MGACVGDSINKWSCRAQIYFFDVAAEGWQVCAAQHAAGALPCACAFLCVALRVETVEYGTGTGNDCDLQEMPRASLSEQHGQWLLSMPTGIQV